MRFEAVETYSVTENKARMLVSSYFGVSEDIRPWRNQFAKVFDTKGKILFFIFLFYF